MRLDNDTLIETYRNFLGSYKIPIKPELIDKVILETFNLLNNIGDWIYTDNKGNAHKLQSTLTVLLNDAELSVNEKHLIMEYALFTSKVEWIGYDIALSIIYKSYSHIKKHKFNMEKEEENNHA